MQNHLKDEIHDVISGKSQVRFGAAIQAVARHLDDGTQAGPKAEIPKPILDQEKKRLEAFASRNGLWIDDIDLSQYISEGAEQRVFLKDSDHVIKLNDGVYYNSWKNYFYNLLLHNYFFPDTAYELLGFTRENEVIYAVVRQSFVEITQETNLDHVKEFLEANGFVNIKNNDFFNPGLGIILEDLHDENVLTRDDVLFFIDTVFYLTESFWK